MNSQKNRKNKRLSDTLLVVPNSFSHDPSRPESNLESGESFVVTRDSGASSVASKRMSASMRLSKDPQEQRRISIISEDVLMTGFPDEQRMTGTDSNKESLQNTEDSM